jgi:hypothetical protein
MTFYRVKEYKICPKGERGVVISIPKTALEDLGVKKGETLSLYRGNIGKVPVVVLANSNVPELAG